MVFAGCTVDGGLGKPDLGDVDLQEFDCEIDPSLSPESAYSGEFDADLTELFCPLRDQDYWKITTTSPMQIVTAELTFQKLSNIRMAMDWYGPYGQCVFASKSCTNNTQCDGATEACDTTRGLCRPNTLSACAGGNGCDSGTTCNVATAGYPIAGAIADLNTGATTIHRLKASFSAIESGDYVVSVFDNSEQEADDFVEYTLNLSQVPNPDTHEPNDIKNLATPLASGSTLSGFLATEGDVDWYRIDYSQGSQPIVTVELRWPNTDTDIDPDWELTQDNWAFPAPAVEVEGNERVRRATIIAPSGPGFLLSIDNAGLSDLTKGYSISVTVEADAQEGASRNDTPATASVMNLGGTPGSVSRTETIIADNDRDWVRFDTAGGNNSLLYVHITGTPTGTLDENTFDYVLEASFYRPCTCGTGGCNTALQIDATTCLESAIWYRLPNPDGSGVSGCGPACDPSKGGRTPNNLETQLPMRNQGTGALYMLVNHIAAAPSSIVGHSADKTYSIAVQHKAEPDSGDLTPGNEDSRFISRPLLGSGSDPSDFRLRYRTAAGTGSTSGGGGASSPFAMLANGRSATPTASVGAEACSEIDVEAFDGQGGPSTQNVAFSSADGGFVADCTGFVAGTTGASPFTKNSIRAGVIGFIPSTGVTMATISTSAGGGPQVPFQTPVSNSPPSAITVTGARNSAVGSVSGPITVNSASGVTVTRLSGGGTVACLEVDTNGCAGTPGCTMAGSAPPCDLPGGDYQFVVQPTNTTLYVIQLSGGSQVPATWVVAPWNPRTWTYGAVTGGEGYLSFAGDNDFFEITGPGSLQRGKMKVDLYHSAGITVRMNVQGDSGGTGVSGGNCNPCSAPGSDCSYVNAGSTFRVEVNEDNHDGWNENDPYYFFVEFTEGCPPECSTYICTQ